MAKRYEGGVEAGTGIQDYNMFAEKQVRLGFVRKVYAILGCQLLVTFGPVLGLTIYRYRYKRVRYMRTGIVLQKQKSRNKASRLFDH